MLAVVSVADVLGADEAAETAATIVLVVRIAVSVAAALLYQLQCWQLFQ